MGRIDDAQEWYEHALEMYEELLEGDSGNVTYQSLEIIILLFRLGCSGLADALLTRTIPKCLTKNKVTKLFGDHPHLWHSCDSFIRDLLMLFLSRFYHECVNV
ncbi:MAG: hypothetical protein C4B59_05135 [Candidatus Methanogaster sp.]|uniref:Uncharacterized protein n=1 Tax=Candidatus Methanogaster sp. TaxID=3386292 RepID=A0AC61L452_9EURY|nr:MAG: hypothetical protein C4B59_05135 [ANME-2 cluster archaeon]